METRAETLTVSQGGQLQHRVQRTLDVRQFFCGGQRRKGHPRLCVSPHTPPVPHTCCLVQEVGQETAHDGLVADDQDVLLPLQLHQHGLQPLHQVFVGLVGKDGLGSVSEYGPGALSLSLVPLTSPFG